MYIQTGLGRRRRRGFGDVCNQNDPDYSAPACEGVSATFVSSPVTCPAGKTLVYGVCSSPTEAFTDWLNANGTTVAIGAAVLLGVMLFARAGR
jgi:hypothetical protein